MAKRASDSTGRREWEADSQDYDLGFGGQAEQSVVDRDG